MNAWQRQAEVWMRLQDVLRRWREALTDDTKRGS